MRFIMQWPNWLIKAVSALKKRLVEKFTKPRRREIFVILQAGMVQEIVHLPPNIDVTVIDYDTDGVDDKELQISPVDGELCVITKW